MIKKSKMMKISVIGTGYVGLVTSVCLAELGHFVICVDEKKEKINLINSGKSPIYEPELENLLMKNIKDQRLFATVDLETAVFDTEISIICVGTPNKDELIDLSQIKTVAHIIGKILQNKNEYHLVVVKSTILPRTTDLVIKNIIESKSGKKIGDFGLCNNPEFLREGRAIEDFMNPDRIVIGAFDDKSAQVLLKVYESFDCPKIVTNSRTAEMIKYTSNSLLALLISFSNEISNICQEIEDIDILDVLNGVHLDRRFSPIIYDEKIGKNIHIKTGMLSYLWAGCGYGGSCFPKDVQTLYFFARELNLDPKMLQSIIEVNENQPIHLFNKVEESIGSLKNKRVAILGLAFKPETDDVRETPALPIIKKLVDKGAIVTCHDPIAMNNAKNGILKSFNIEYAKTKEEAIDGAEIVFLITKWKEYYEISPQNFKKSLKGKNPTVVDGRRIYNKKDIELQNIKYIGIGVK